MSLSLQQSLLPRLITGEVEEGLAVDVFEVDSNILRSARISNRKRDKFIKAMGNTKLSKELKQYFKTYPSAPLLLQDESGVMVRLRR